MPGSPAGFGCQFGTVKHAALFLAPVPCVLMKAVIQGVLEAGFEGIEYAEPP